MPNSWGRPPRNNLLWQDIQSLGFWILILGLAAYLLFPSLLGDISSRGAIPTSQSTDSSPGIYDPNSDTRPYGTDSPKVGTSIPSYINPVNTSMYMGNEVSSGYWVFFVAEGDFKQLPATNESYQFILRLIEKDKNSTGKNTIILTANGQIKKYVVSDEVYAIITSMAAIDSRSK